MADPPPTKLCHTGHVQQCGYHSQQNSVDDFLKALDPELFIRVVSVVKVCKNPFNEPDMKAAIKYLLSDDPKVRVEIDSRTDFFKLVKAGIEAQATPTETKPRGDGISLKEAKEDMGYIDLDIDEDFWLSRPPPAQLFGGLLSPSSLHGWLCRVGQSLSRCCTSAD